MARFITPDVRLRVMAGLLATACAVVFATRVFVAADPVRLRVVTAAVPGQAGEARASLMALPVGRLGAVAAVVARIRHDGDGAGTFAIAIDGAAVCATTIPRGTARVDCAWHRTAAPSGRGEVVVRGPQTAWTLEYLELATHHGGTAGFVNVLVLPRESDRAIAPSAAWAVLVWVVCGAVLLLAPARAESRPGRALSAVPGLAVVVLFAAALVSPWVSPYRLVLSVWTCAGAIALALAPRVWAAAREPTPRALRIERSLAVALAATTAVIALAAGARAVGGSDSYGYVSQAELWLRGDLTVEQPLAADAPWPNAIRTFAPLGYVPHPETPHALVPGYPAGLPLLLAAASWLGGTAAMFWVVPVSAGLFVLASYGLGRRLAGGGVGLAAAWLVATSPVVVAQSVAVMTDVPVAAAWTGAAFFVLGGDVRSVRSALAAGLCAGLAVLIRPNLVPLAAVLGSMYLRELCRADDRRAELGRLIAFTSAAASGAIAVAVINATLYGSPLSSGYGDVSVLFDPGRVWTNLRLYLTWFAQMHAFLPLAGLAALFVPAGLLPWSAAGRRALPFMTALVVLVWLIYAGWIVFDTWLFARFLLPSWPLIMTGFGVIAAALSRRRAIGGWAVVLVVAVGVMNLRTNADYRTLTFGREADRYVAAAQLARRYVPANGVVVSLLHSGTLRHYGGLTTLNYRYLEGAWLDRAVAWLQARGIKAYALLDDSELGEFRERFAGSQALDAVTRGPIASLSDEPTRLFEFVELVEPAATRVP